MIFRSVAARLMMPLAMSMLMLCLLASVMIYTQDRVSAANEAALDSQTRVNQLSELRSISRSLQRDDLNLITETDPVERQGVVAKFNGHMEQYTNGLDALEASPNHGQLPAEYFRLQRVVAQQAADIATAANNHDPNALIAFRTKVRPAERASSKLADARIEALHKEVDELTETARSATQSAQTLVIVATIVLSVAGLAFGFLLTRKSVVRPLLDLRAAMSRLAAGDTDTAIPHIGREDEVGQMAKSMAVFRDQLAAAEKAKAVQADLIVSSIGAGLDELAGRNLSARVDAELTGQFSKLKSDFNRAMTEISGTMQSVNHATAAINGGAGEIRQASGDLAERTERQAASLQETATALNEVTTSVRETADGAASARNAIGATQTQATEGRKVLSEAAQAMDDIQKSAQEISQIINVIDGIAFQTNLLALNAGVEAARAGEAGKGFAVVANEVRALALRSADAASDIKGLIQGSGDLVDRGVGLVSQSGQAFDVIVEQVTEVSRLILSISEQTSRQSQSLTHVNGAIHDMDRTTQQNAAMVEETNAAVRSLADEANRLEEMVRQFKVEGGMAATPRRAAPAPRRAPMPRVVGNTALAVASDEDWSEF